MRMNELSGNVDVVRYTVKICHKEKLDKQYSRNMEGR